MKRLMKTVTVVGAALMAVFLAACGVVTRKNAAENTVIQKSANMRLSALKDSIHSITEDYEAEIGAVLITDNGDTVVVNNENKYPLMSVFKLHQAMALCHDFEKAGRSLDTALSIPRSSLNPDTWSPMLKEHTGDTIKLTVRELLRYTLMQSDNNASNLLFRQFTSVKETDAFIASLIPRRSFRLVYDEEEMSADHRKCYSNSSSPLGVAILLGRLYTDSVIGTDNQDFICRTLRECKTGTDRIVAPLQSQKGVTVGHKTGSGFRENGILAAHNDAGFITYGDGRHYTLVVLVKDFHGDETAAAGAIARISAAVYRALSRSSY